MDAVTASILLVVAGALLTLGAMKAVAILSPPGPAPPAPQAAAAPDSIVPLLATLHDELATVRRDLADIATAISLSQDAREASLLKQINDLHDRVMVVMSPAFLREFRRQAITPEERIEMMGRRQQDLRNEAATRRIHYPGFEPDLRPRVPNGGIDSVVEADAAIRRGVMAESFDDLPEDRSGDLVPDASTPEGALTAAHRGLQGGRR